MAILFAAVLLALFYVFLILPKQREMKRHNALVASLDVGDEVMTGSGFYGTLTEVTDDTVLVELSPGVEVKLARRAVAAKIVEPAPTSEPGVDQTELAADHEPEPAADQAADVDVDDEADR